jgi:hypothetical protein
MVKKRSPQDVINDKKYRDDKNVCIPQFEVTKAVDDFLAKHNLEIEFTSKSHAQDYAIKK